METVQSSAALRDGIKSLESWHYEDHALVREFKFGAFSEAISFIIRISFLAEALEHHPEILNTYDRVRVRLWTHEANDVTMRDLDLARAIDRVCWV